MAITWPTKRRILQPLNVVITKLSKISKFTTTNFWIRCKSYHCKILQILPQQNVANIATTKFCHNKTLQTCHGIMLQILPRQNIANIAGGAYERLHPPVACLHRLHNHRRHAEGLLSLIWGDDDDNDQENDQIYEKCDEVYQESDDNYPTNQIDEGLKLQCDDLDRLGSAVGELAIQVFPLFSSIFKEGPWSLMSPVGDEAWKEK